MKNEDKDMIPAVMIKACTIPGQSLVRVGFKDLHKDDFARLSTRPNLAAHGAVPRFGFVHAMYRHGMDPNLVGDSKTEAIRELSSHDHMCLGLDAKEGSKDGHVLPGSLKGATISAKCVRDMSSHGRAILEEIAKPLGMTIETPMNIDLSTGNVSRATMHLRATLRETRNDPAAIVGLLEKEGAFHGVEGKKVLDTLAARAAKAPAAPAKVSKAGAK